MLQILRGPCPLFPPLKPTPVQKQQGFYFERRRALGSLTYLTVTEAAKMVKEICTSATSHKAELAEWELVR